MSKLLNLNRLNLHWIETALEGWVVIEEANVKRTLVKEMCRELVFICRDQRNRAIKAEKFYEKYRNDIPYADKQDILLLLLEMLKYAKHNGI